MIGLATMMTKVDLETKAGAIGIEVTKEIEKQNAIRQTIMLKGEEAIIDGVKAGEALVKSEITLAALEEEQISLQQLIYAKNEPRKY